jgi:hypothetical protein
LRNWPEQRPSNKGKSALRVSRGSVGKCVTRDGSASHLIYYGNGCLLLSCLLNGTPCSRSVLIAHLNSS